MIEIKIDAAKVKTALDLAPRQLAEEISFELRRWAVNGLSDFTRKRLSVPDDRDRGDFLLRRPRKSQGLRRVTGALARAAYAAVKPARTLDQVEGRVGWLSGKQARIARVHELGTVGKGGLLPDIRPKGRYLAARIYRAGARGRVRIAYLQKVAIPPRLGWVQWFASAKAVKALMASINKAAARAIRKSVTGA